VSAGRGFLSVLVLAGVLLLAAGALWIVSRIRLPDPGDCDRRQLLRWLVSRDLDKESFDLRLRLLRRLEQQIRIDADWSRFKGWLTEQSRQRLANNVTQLVEPWFIDKLEHYVGLPPEQRTAYVDQILDRLSAMRGLAAVTGANTPSGAPGQGRLAKALLEQIPQWQQRAEPQRRREIGEFLTALQTRWVSRQLFGAVPPLRPAG
jgi:hypothetical protein